MSDLVRYDAAKPVINIQPQSSAINVQTDQFPSNLVIRTPVSIQVERSKAASIAKAELALIQVAKPSEKRSAQISVARPRTALNEFEIPSGALPLRQFQKGDVIGYWTTNERFMQYNGWVATVLGNPYINADLRPRPNFNLDGDPSEECCLWATVPTSESGKSIYLTESIHQIVPYDQSWGILIKRPKFSPGDWVVPLVGPRRGDHLIVAQYDYLNKRYIMLDPNFSFREEELYGIDGLGLEDWVRIENYPIVPQLNGVVTQIIGQTTEPRRAIFAAVEKPLGEQYASELERRYWTVAVSSTVLNQPPGSFEFDIHGRYLVKISGPLH